MRNQQPYFCYFNYKINLIVTYLSSIYWYVWNRFHLVNNETLVLLKISRTNVTY